MIVCLGPYVYLWCIEAPKNQAYCLKGRHLHVSGCHLQQERGTPLKNAFPCGMQYCCAYCALGKSALPSGIFQICVCSASTWYIGMVYMFVDTLCNAWLAGSHTLLSFQIKSPFCDRVPLVITRVRLVPGMQHDSMLASILSSSQIQSFLAL
jgi:hypothetical protein